MSRRRNPARIVSDARNELDGLSEMVDRFTALETVNDADLRETTLEAYDDAVAEVEAARSALRGLMPVVPQSRRYEFEQLMGYLDDAQAEFSKVHAEVSKTEFEPAERRLKSLEALLKASHHLNLGRMEIESSMDSVYARDMVSDWSVTRRLAKEHDPRISDAALDAAGEMRGLHLDFEPTPKFFAGVARALDEAWAREAERQEAADAVAAE
ncbi:hypothetical protein WME88_27665 [Sorangium sp. So ce216]